MQCLGRSRCKHQSYAIFRVEGSLSFAAYPTCMTLEASGTVNHYTKRYRKESCVGGKGVINRCARGELTLRVGQRGHNFQLDHLREAFLNNDNPPTPIPASRDWFTRTKKKSNFVRPKLFKSTIDEPQRLNSNDLTPHLEYAHSWKMTTSYSHIAKN
ncbi:hypothetical protein Tco_0967602 [Tanacetum coccineum]